MIKFEPLHDKVLVRRFEQEGKTISGIIIPDNAKEKSSEGEIVAIGKGIIDEKGHLRPLDVKVGDKVVFGKWGGTEVKVDGKDYVVMKESDLLGILRG